MQVTVLVEPLADGTGYLARAGEPFSVSVEGSTRPEAVSALETRPPRSPRRRRDGPEHSIGVNCSADSNFRRSGR